MKIYVGVQVYLHAFITTALDGECYGRLNPRDESSSSHWILRLGGAHIRCGCYKKEKGIRPRLSEPKIQYSSFCAIRVSNLIPRLLGERLDGAVVHVVILEARVRFHEVDEVSGTSTSVFPNNY